MKKLVILGTALLALNAIASEGQLKFGYDFSRDAKYGEGENLKFKKGPVLGAEYIFDNQGEFEWGVGAEYKLSSNSGKLKDKFNNKQFRSAPVYALGKFNLVTTQSGNDALYVLGRAGYNFANEAREKASNTDISGGLYGAVGLGTEFGPVSLEALYEKAGFSVKNRTTEARDRDSLDTFGVRLGYRFGQLKNDRGPKIVKEVVTVEKPLEVIKTQPAPQQKTLGVKTVELPFSCSASEKKCVIRGFKVDGREPNEAEARDLGTIANVINQFAEGGSIDFVGHTDSTGSDAYNQKLSVSRAQNVARLLKEYGLKNTVSYGTITGRGESQPVDTNNTVKGRYNNRRVELFFQNVDFENVRFVDGN